MTRALTAKHGWTMIAILLSCLVVAGCPPRKPEPIVTAVDAEGIHHVTP